MKAEERELNIVSINLEETDVNVLRDEFPNAALHVFTNSFEFLSSQVEGSLTDLIITKGHYRSPNCYSLTQQLNTQPQFNRAALIMELEDTISDEIRKDAMRHSVSELFDDITTKDERMTRIKYILDNPTDRHVKSKSERTVIRYRTPFFKRTFDLVFSLSTLLILSPLFLLIAALIRLESRGKVFYYSYRVGTGYKIFKFYKFRSMYTGADQKLRELAHLNQYNEEGEERESDATMHAITDHSTIEESKGLHGEVLYMDGNAITEEEYSRYRKTKDGSTFVKLKDDPRITKVGKFIRNTSIDELPQLWNVVKGDMSIVGNRPLPLYEAERLTTDRFAARFLAPAGITGLWQVTKRGKGEMSEEERMELDNDYAKDYSFGRDIILILKTIPALFQKENV